MKPILLCHIFFTFFQVAHSQCLVNGDFSNWTGTDYMVVGCKSISSSSLNNWKRSHGTPNVIAGVTPVDNTVFMFGQNFSEGIFASYNFQANTSYLVRIKMHASVPPTLTDGGTYIYAANSMVEGPALPTYVFDCGGAVPPVSSKSLIRDVKEFGGVWREFAFNYSPGSSSFSQLWLYPYGVNGKYDLHVDYINACEGSCNTNGNLYVAVGTLAATSSIQYGYIHAGTSLDVNSSGVVSVSATANTALIASNEINLLPDFEAIVTSGEFSARIIPCDPSFSNPSTRYMYEPQFRASGSGRNLPDSSSGTTDREAAFENSLVKVYPNPASTILKIELGGKFKPESIQLISLDGRVVKNFDQASIGKNDRTVELDVHAISSGMYYLKIKGNTSTQVKKINIVR